MGLTNLNPFPQSKIRSGAPVRNNNGIQSPQVAPTTMVSLCRPLSQHKITLKIARCWPVIFARRPPRRLALGADADAMQPVETATLDANTSMSLNDLYQLSANILRRLFSSSSHMLVEPRKRSIVPLDPAANFTQRFRGKLHARSRGHAMLNPFAIKDSWLDP